MLCANRKGNSCKRNSYMCVCVCICKSRFWAKVFFIFLFCSLHFLWYNVNWTLAHNLNTKRWFFPAVVVASSTKKGKNSRKVIQTLLHYIHVCLSYSSVITNDNGNMNEIFFSLFLNSFFGWLFVHCWQCGNKSIQNESPLTPHRPQFATCRTM